MSTTRDRAKILQIERFIRFPSKYAAVGFFPTKERLFPQKSDKLFLRRGVLDERKKGGTKKSNLFFRAGISEKQPHDKTVDFSKVCDFERLKITKS